MAEDLIRQKAEFLFRKYGLIRDISSGPAGTVKGKEPQFTKDFLAEVQNAARELALKQRADVINQISNIDSNIADAERFGDFSELDRLQKEKKELEKKLSSE
jgi:hypothetical protein